LLLLVLLLCHKRSVLWLAGFLQASGFVCMQPIIIDLNSPRIR
jgi:hypothetical protein